MGKLLNQAIKMLEIAVKDGDEDASLLMDLFAGVQAKHVRGAPVAESVKVLRPLAGDLLIITVDQPIHSEAYKAAMELGQHMVDVSSSSVVVVPDWISVDHMSSATLKMHLEAVDRHATAPPEMPT